MFKPAIQQVEKRENIKKKEPQDLDGEKNLAVEKKWRGRDKHKKKKVHSRRSREKI